MPDLSAALACKKIHHKWSERGGGLMSFLGAKLSVSVVDGAASSSSPSGNDRRQQRQQQQHLHQPRMPKVTFLNDFPTVTVFAAVREEAWSGSGGTAATAAAVATTFASDGGAEPLVHHHAESEEESSHSVVTVDAVVRALQPETPGGSAFETLVFRAARFQPQMSVAGQPATETATAAAATAAAAAAPPTPSRLPLPVGVADGSVLVAIGAASVGGLPKHRVESVLREDVRRRSADVLRAFAVRKARLEIVPTEFLQPHSDEFCFSGDEDERGWRESMSVVVGGCGWRMAMGWAAPAVWCLRHICVSLCVATCVCIGTCVCVGGCGCVCLFVCVSVALSNGN